MPEEIISVAEPSIFALNYASLPNFYL